MSGSDKYYSSYKMQMLIKENEKKRNLLQKQLLDGRKLVSAKQAPEEYQKASDLEMKVDILKKSLDNVEDACSLVELVETALLNLVTILQTLLEVTIQARQPGISDVDILSFMSTIQSLETEFESTLNLYTWKNQSIFYHKDRLTITDKKTWEVAKKIKWNVTDSVLKPLYLTFTKPKIIVKGLEKNFLFKVNAADPEVYISTGITTSSSTNQARLDYNILVIQSDIKLVQKYLGDLAVFNNLVAIKKQTLLSVYGSNLESLNKLVGIDREHHKAEINHLNCQIQTARKVFRGLCENDPVTNTVSSTLQNSTGVFKQI